MARRISLVRHVICSIPIHIMSIYDLLKTIIKIIEKLMDGFICSFLGGGVDRYHGKWCVDLFLRASLESEQ